MGIGIFHFKPGAYNPGRMRQPDRIFPEHRRDVPCAPGLRTLLSVLLLVALAGMVPADAHGSPPQTKAEIEHLIGYLENSDCTMIRNGRSHDAGEAAGHVRRKYEHFGDRIGSAEDFIALAATRSMVSGQEYEVHCPGRPPVSSRSWLGVELKAFRDGS
jgi:hypothetical protein